MGPHPPYRGGIAHFTQATTRGLEERGHAVVPVSYRRQYPAFLFPGTSQFAPEAGETISEMPGGTGGGPAGAARWLDSIGPASWRATARRIAEAGSDAAVLMHWMPFFAPALGTVARGLRRRGVRTVGVVHNALPHERRPGDRALTRYFLGACDGLVVMSDAVRRDVEALGYGGAVRQVHHPVYDHFGAPVPREAARAALGLPAEAPVFLFFGFVRPYKGLPVLLDAFAHVVARVPEARLVVAGEFYGDEAALRAQAAPLGEAVRFDADYIPDARVALYFGAADAVVQPYVSATQSGVAQIAFHFGRPVVTTDVGGLAEVVPDGEAGLVVPPSDPAALAAALVRFVEEDLGARLAEGVARARERFSWDRLLEAIEDLAGLSQEADRGTAP